MLAVAAPSRLPWVAQARLRPQLPPSVWRGPRRRASPSRPPASPSRPPGRPPVSDTRHCRGVIELHAVVVAVGREDGPCVEIAQARVQRRDALADGELRIGERVEPLILVKQCPQRRVPSTARAYLVAVRGEPRALLCDESGREATSTSEEQAHARPLGACEGCHLAQTAGAQHFDKLVLTVPTLVHLHTREPWSGGGQWARGGSHDLRGGRGAQGETRSPAR
eukprot:scaffold15975_cov27-Tisochrysis_lutea.AAC.4